MRGRGGRNTHTTHSSTLYVCVAKGECLRNYMYLSPQDFTYWQIVKWFHTQLVSECTGEDVGHFLNECWL